MNPTLAALIILAATNLYLFREVRKLRSRLNITVDPEALKSEVNKAASAVVERRILAWEAEEEKREAAEEATELKRAQELEAKMLKILETKRYVQVLPKHPAVQPGLLPKQ